MKLVLADIERYGDRVDSIADKAGEAAARMYDEMRAENPNASVAEVREGIIEIAESVIASYGDMACELAAMEYDAMAEESGAKVPDAELPEIDDEMLEAVRGRVRYIVGALVHDDERFDI